MNYEKIAITITDELATKLEDRATQRYRAEKAGPMDRLLGRGEAKIAAVQRLINRTSDRIHTGRGKPRSRSRGYSDTRLSQDIQKTKPAQAAAIAAEAAQAAPAKAKFSPLKMFNAGAKAVGSVAAIKAMLDKQKKPPLLHTMKGKAMAATALLGAGAALNRVVTDRPK